MVTTITPLTTSTFMQALLFGSGRKIDVDSIGRRWVAINDGGTITF